MKEAALAARTKLAKLAAMEPAEFADRLIESCHGIRERFVSGKLQFHNKGSYPGLAGDRAHKMLREGDCPASLLLPRESREALVAGYQKFFPERLEKICGVGDQICRGTVRLFGRDVSFPDGRIDWHLDWGTGEHLAIDFYRDIRKLDPERKIDLKRVWETNRQQFLVTLGQSYFLTGDERYAECALTQIESWMAANPPFYGVNWMESLEVSLRLCSWVWTLALITEAKCLTAKRAKQILACIQTQRYFIEAHLSTYSSPNTHLLGEAMGMFIVGTVLGGLDGAHTCVARAQKILESELRRQFADDGSHREQSSYYHAYAVEMYLLVFALGSRKRIAFPPHWTDRLISMCDYLRSLCRPNGDLARFGDDDGGRTLRLGEEDYYKPKSLSAFGEILFARNELQSGENTPPEELFWIFGTEGLQCYFDFETSHESKSPLRFPDAGYAVLSKELTGSRFWLACSGKPMGINGSGHSHAAPLSFEMAVDDVPIIVDPGTFSYAQTEWRDLFRGERSHSLLMLEDAERLTTNGPFGWKNKNAVQPIPLGDDKESVRLEMSYTGRDGSGCSYLHSRSFSCESATCLRMEDQVRGDGTHRTTLRLQFSPMCSIEASAVGEFVVRCGRVVLQVSHFARSASSGTNHVWTASLVKGWYSARYGEQMVAPALCFEGTMDLPASSVVRFSVKSNPS
jgi:hypothetical protein